MEKLIGLKELRENIDTFVKKIDSGESFVVFRKSKPIFKLSPVDEGGWEEVIDFTKLKKGGIEIDDLLTRL
jgi:antitoxin (DNA-binding transcriptional repressor) of toxin-antitoxin stability system